MAKTYYRTCPYCGAALDPGERCDCEAQEDRSRADEKVVVKA